MRFSLKIFLTGILMYFYLSGKARSQLSIAKDYNACLYGLVDNSGKWIVPATYTRITAIAYNNFFIVLKDNLYGLLNQDGKINIPVIYSDLQTIHDTHPYYSLSSYKPERRELTSYSESNASFEHFYQFLARKNGLVGILDTNGFELIPISFFAIGNFVNGVAEFLSADKKTSGLLDLHGIRGYFKGDMQQRYQGTENRGYGIWWIWHFDKGAKIDSRSKRYCGVFNDSCRLIIPMEYDSINVYYGYRNIIEVYKNGRTGYFNKKGEKLFDPIYIVPGAGHSKVSTLALYGSIVVSDGKKWGVIDLSGKIIADFIYDEIQPYQDHVQMIDDYYSHADSLMPRWKVKKENKWGLITSNGRGLLQTLYQSIYPQTTYYLNDSVLAYILYAKKDNKWGAISESGFEMMPFDYDTLFPYPNGFIFWSEKSVDLFYMFSDYTIIGLYDYNPLEEKKRIEDEWKAKVAAGDDSTQEPFINQSGYFGKWTEGEVFNNYTGRIIPFSDTYSYDEKKFFHYEFGKCISAQSGFLVTHMERTPLKDKSVFLYTGFKVTKSNYDADDFPRTVEKSSEPLLLSKQKDGSLENTPLVLLSTDTKFSYYKMDLPSPGILRSDGKIIIQPGIYEDVQSFADTKNEFLVTTKYYHLFGVQNAEGKLLLDSVWRYIQNSSGDSLWVEQGGTACSAAWNVFIMSKNKFVFRENKELSSQVPLDGGIHFASTRDGQGLFNTSTLEFISPLYPYVDPLNDPSTKYFVMDCNGMGGVMNVTGKNETGLNWTTVIRLNPSRSMMSDYDSSQKGKRAQQQFLFRNQNSWGFYDTKTGFKMGDTTLEYNIIAIAENEASKNNYAGRFDNNFETTQNPWIEMRTADHTIKSWQRNILFDSVFFSSQYIDYRESFWHNENCNCTKGIKSFSPDKGYKINYARIHHIVVFKTDSSFILEKEATTESSNQYNLPEYYNWDHFYYNYILFPDGPRIMKLDSLFDGVEWKLTVENAAMNFLKDHPTIETPCSNSAKYPEIFEDVFVITKEGIIIYPDWQYPEGNNNQARISFLIQWSELKPYLRKDVASKINIKN